MLRSCTFRKYQNHPCQLSFGISAKSLNLVCSIIKEKIEAPFVGSYIHAGNKIATLVGLSASADGAEVVAKQMEFLNDNLGHLEPVKLISVYVSSPRYLLPILQEIGNVISTHWFVDVSVRELEMKLTIPGITAFRMYQRRYN